MTVEEDRDETTEPSDDEPGEETPANDRHAGAGHVPPPPPIGPKKGSKEEKEEAKKKRGRPSGKIGRIPEGVDSPSDADILWADVLERIQAEGRSAHEMVVRVARTSPGPYAPLGPLEASSVEGGGEHDPSPSDLLRDAIIDTFHLSQSGPATYEVVFAWKRGATFYDRSKLHLPAMREIELVRNAIARRNGQQQLPPQYAPRPPQGVGAPQPQYAPPPPTYYQPPGYAPQPPQQPERAADDPLVVLLREMRSEQVRLAARVEQIATGQQPPPTPAAGPVTPPPGMIDAIQQFAVAAEALKKLGVNLGPGLAGVAGVPAPVAAAASPAPPPPPTKTEEEIIDGYFARMEKDADRKRRMAKALGATLPEDQPEDEEETEEKKEPEKPGLGFHPHVIPNAHWPDGSPMQHATDDNGNWDIGGIVMSNPFIIDKMGTQLLRVVEKVVEKVGVQGLGQKPPQQEHLPEETEPNGAAQKKDWTL